jgi:hemoglobin-like flavoprotein
VTREEKQLVENSFEALHDVAQPMVMLFYGRLFELDPTLRGMFKAPMKEQAAKLVATLQVAVDGMGDLAALQPKLRELGRHHAGLGVETRHYALVEQALLWAITRALEGGCSAATRGAWQKLLRTISEEMIAGAS